MVIKRFMAPTMSLAVAMVKDEFGEDAVILSTGHIKKPGIFGWFLRRWVTVIAGVEPAEEQMAPATEPPAAEPELNPPPADPRRASPVSAEKMTQLTTHYLLEKLKQQDVAAHHLDNLRELLPERVAKVGESPKVLLQKLLAEQLPRFTPWQSLNRSLVVALVGPTGVGKTTTIIKLAARYGLEAGWPVGLITADTYRVAAAEQLRTTAEILGIPVEVVYSPAEVAGALAKLAGRRLILVDTAGRSHFTNEHMQELRDFIRALPEPLTYLTISAATRFHDLVQMMERFAAFVAVDGLIVTKLDETNIYGSIYNAARHLNKPVAFLTTGQNVPEDLEEADNLKIAGLLAGLVRERGN
ncbi:MAG TPA: hypothetical protein GXX29_09390 [Firmicutes bacterium]|nr:hypothetical protein [Bacillota bacterium]